MRVFDEERAQELFEVYREFNHRVHDKYVTVFRECWSCATTCARAAFRLR